jgi:AraC family transcriptional regulator
LPILVFFIEFSYMKMNTFASASEKEYIHRINAVLDYIDQHLDQELSLHELANVATFSKYHFHRIFYALMGETLFQYLRRIRLEKACYLLSLPTQTSITEIAFQTGFSTLSGFTRSFTEIYGVSPRQWKTKHQKNSNLNQINSNSSKEKPSFNSYTRYQLSLRRSLMSLKEHEVVIKDCPEKTVAYIRHIGPYKENSELFDSLSQKLCAWAGPRNLLQFPETEFIIIYHDNPDITEEGKLRISVCITVPPQTPVEGEIGKMTVPAGKYAFARFRLGKTGYQEAWDWVFGQWLPGSGFAPDDRLCYEQYYGSPEGSPDGKMDLDIVIPVKPL